MFGMDVIFSGNINFAYAELFNQLKTTKTLDVDNIENVRGFGFENSEIWNPKIIVCLVFIKFN
mgnify:CR=1 FL=1